MPMTSLKERLASDGAGWEADDTLTQSGADVINGLCAEALARIEALEAALHGLLSFELMAKWSADRKGDFPAAVVSARLTLEGGSDHAE